MTDSHDIAESKRFPWMAVLLLVLYLLSIGPVYGLAVRGMISNETASFLGSTVYAPLAWLVKLSPTASDVILGYCSLFWP